MKTAVASLPSHARKNVVPEPREDPDDQRHRREAEQHQRDDLGEDDRQRQEPEQDHRPQRADEDHHRQRQPLKRAALLLDVDRRRVGLVDLIAGELARRRDGSSPSRSTSYSRSRSSEPAGWRRKRGA